jgi:hypothetical protein
MFTTISNTPTPALPTSLSVSQPNLLLRAEGLAFFIGSIALYASQGFNGWVFVLLLLVPDVAMLGYLVNPRIGSLAYNIAHVYILPLLLMALGAAGGAPFALQLGIIWFAHISMDRVAGYGFKYATAFKDTHMQRV